MYEIDESYIERNKDIIEAGKAIDVKVRNPEDLCWKKVKALISPSPIEGGERLQILSSYGLQSQQGDWYIKILEDLPDDAPVYVSDNLKGW